MDGRLPDLALARKLVNCSGIPMILKSYLLTGTARNRILLSSIYLTSLEVKYSARLELRCFGLSRYFAAQNLSWYAKGNI